MVVPLVDDEADPLLPHLPAALGFIHEALTGHASAAAAVIGDDDEDALTGPVAAAAAGSGVGKSGAGRVLVHCQAGRSRSVSIVVAYIMRSRGIGAQEVRCGGGDEVCVWGVRCGE